MYLDGRVNAEMGSPKPHSSKPTRLPVGATQAIAAAERLATAGQVREGDLPPIVLKFIVDQLRFSAVAVGVADPVTDRFLLLQDPTLQPDELHKSYFPVLRVQPARDLLAPDPDHDDIALAVGALFIAERSLVPLSRSLPEFYAHLLRRSSFVKLDQALSRAAAPAGDCEWFLYCPVEEVTLFLHQWRSRLCSHANADPLESSDVSVLARLRGAMPGAESHLRRVLRGWDLLRLRAQGGGRSARPVPPDRWEALGLHAPQFLRRVVAYATRLQREIVQTPGQRVAVPTRGAPPAEFDRYLANSFQATLCAAGVPADDPAAMYRSARFPLLPMFALALARGVPQAHLVVPTWESRHLARYSAAWSIAHEESSSPRGQYVEVTESRPATHPDQARPAGAAFVLASLASPPRKMSVESIALAARLLFRPLSADLIESRFYEGSLVLGESITRASESMFVLSHETRQLLTLIDERSAPGTLRWVRDYLTVWMTFSLALGGSPDSRLDERYVPSDILEIVSRQATLLDFCRVMFGRACEGRTLLVRRNMLDPQSAAPAAEGDAALLAASVNLDCIDDSGVDRHMNVVPLGQDLTLLRARLAFFLAGVAAVGNALKHTTGVDKVSVHSVGRDAIRVRNRRSGCASDDSIRPGGTGAVLLRCFRALGKSAVAGSFGPDRENSAYWVAQIPFPLEFVQ